MKNILTLDEAFSDTNIVPVENALFDLNKNGVFDPNFLTEAKKHLTTREADFNVGELFLVRSPRKNLTTQ